jgi:hypothetical protein
VKGYLLRYIDMVQSNVGAEILLAINMAKIICNLIVGKNYIQTCSEIDFTNVQMLVSSKKECMY